MSYDIYIPMWEPESFFLHKKAQGKLKARIVVGGRRRGGGRGLGGAYCIKLDKFVLSTREALILFSTGTKRKKSFLTLPSVTRLDIWFQNVKIK
jgi:hypothetical protein